MLRKRGCVSSVLGRVGPAGLAAERRVLAEIGRLAAEVPFLEQVAGDPVEGGAARLGRLGAGLMSGPCEAGGVLIAPLVAPGMFVACCCDARIATQARYLSESASSIGTGFHQSRPEKRLKPPSRLTRRQRASAAVAAM